MHRPSLSSASAKAALEATCRALYGTGAIALFGLAVLVTLIVVILPGLGLKRRRVLAHVGAEAFLRIVGMPVTLSGFSNLPVGPCVLVANHSSYLDGVVLKAALPARFCFVIKKEIVKVPLAAALLRGIGAQFVNRFNRHDGAMDARRLIKAARAGQSLVFFPEGTISAAPGLARFHSGAFATAMRARVPVVPAVIQGTRRSLPLQRLLPRWSRLQVQILDPIATVDAHGEPISAEVVRQRAREQMLAVLGEPDLAHNDGVALVASKAATRMATRE